MIKEVTLHTIICDGCGKNICDNTDYSCMDEEFLDMEMSEQDWLEIDNKHYCTNCTEWDEEKDERILKKKSK